MGLVSGGEGAGLQKQCAQGGAARLTWPPTERAATRRASWAAAAWPRARDRNMATAEPQTRVRSLLKPRHLELCRQLCDTTPTHACQVCRNRSQVRVCGSVDQKYARDYKLSRLRPHTTRSRNGARAVPGLPVVAGARAPRRGARRAAADLRAAQHSGRGRAVLLSEQQRGRLFVLFVVCAERQQHGLHAAAPGDLPSAGPRRQERPPGPGARRRRPRPLPGRPHGPGPHPRPQRAAREQRGHPRPALRPALLAQRRRDASVLRPRHARRLGAGPTHPSSPGHDGGAAAPALPPPLPSSAQEGSLLQPQLWPQLWLRLRLWLWLRPWPWLGAGCC